MRKATDMSTPHGRVSFPIVCLACSKRRYGRWRQLVQQLVPQTRDHASTSAPACAGCGAERWSWNVQPVFDDQECGHDPARTESTQSPSDVMEYGIRKMLADEATKRLDFR